MFNVTHSMGRVARVFGLLALVAAFAGGFALTPGHAAAAADQPVGTLVVHTRTESGADVNNALVKLYNQAGTNVAKAFTDAKGNAAFKVAAGSYKASVTAQSYQATSTPAEVAAGKIVNLAVTLKNSTRTVGIPTGQLQVQVRTQGGTNIAQAEVYLRDGQNLVAAKGLTDASGQVSITAPEGKYSVEVLAKDYQDYKTPGAVEIIGGQKIGVDVALRLNSPALNN